MRWLMYFLRCPHEHTEFRRDPQGVSMQVCARCGHARPTISRTVEEQARVLTHRPAHEQMRARRSEPAVVVQMRKAQQ